MFKSSAVDALIDLIAVLENQLQPLRVTEFHSDQGREFDNSVLDAYAAQWGSVGRDARDYIAEVDVITGERCFDQARAVLAARYCEVLSAEAAPHPGRSYVSARCTPLA